MAGAVTNVRVTEDAAKSIRRFTGLLMSASGEQLSMSDALIISTRLASRASEIEILEMIREVKSTGEDS